MTAESLKNNDGDDGNQRQNERILDETLPLARCQVTMHFLETSFHVIQEPVLLAFLNKLEGM